MIRRRKVRQYRIASANAAYDVRWRMRHSRVGDALLLKSERGRNYW
jgi:hypothetical protein